MGARRAGLLKSDIGKSRRDIDPAQDQADACVQLYGMHCKQWLLLVQCITSTQSLERLVMGWVSIAQAPSWGSKESLASLSVIRCVATPLVPHGVNFPEQFGPGLAYDVSC
jgi:hypothetical protein